MNTTTTTDYRRNNPPLTRREAHRAEALSTMAATAGCSPSFELAQMIAHARQRQIQQHALADLLTLGVASRFRNRA